MADIELVIKIPEDEYNIIKKSKAPMGWVEHLIANGTPLPKGHGRLIDADALWKKWVFDAIGKQEIDDAPTIIEADKAESEEAMEDYIKQLKESAVE